MPILNALSIISRLLLSALAPITINIHMVDGNLAASDTTQIMPASRPFLTIAEASRLIESKKLSPVELTAAMLAAIAALNGRLHAYLVVLEESAMAAAKTAETEIMAGRIRGPLHGIPVGLKDLFDTAAVKTTGNSAAFRDRVPSADATIVAKLKAAGAIILGKQTAWEFGIGGASTDLPWPPARNPWNLERDPAGSSSGTAAAIAAGLCLAGLGTDTGGSIRGPAAWCGLAGIKPSFGLVSKAGVMPLSDTLDHMGPLAWTAEDCRLIMQVIAGYDPADPKSIDRAPPDFSASIERTARGLKIGLVRDYYEKQIVATTPVRRAFDESVAALKTAGAEFVDVSIPPLAAFADAGSKISPYEGWKNYGALIEANPAQFAARTRTRLEPGKAVTLEAHRAGVAEKERLAARVDDALEAVGFLLLPTSSEGARALGDDSLAPGRSPFYNRSFNLSGHPAMSVCNGFTPDDLPIGIQIVGRRWQDDRVLALGHFLERAAGTRSRRPVVASESG
ncbi:MAG: amidase [Alphaproteobacteria bacterium]|nr:amidase [Alphaproteobacteria bacterium]